jgi:hypothetical protein
MELKRRYQSVCYKALLTVQQTTQLQLWLSAVEKGGEQMEKAVKIRYSTKNMMMVLIVTMHITIP